MGILSWIIFGLIAGAIAKLLMPGRDPGGWIVTILLGIAGSFVGGFLASTLLGNESTSASLEIRSSCCPRRTGLSSARSTSAAATPIPSDSWEATARIAFGSTSFTSFSNASRSPRNASRLFAHAAASACCFASGQ